jgi:ADP-ribose pyrophosphatase YjhB (NUDIX family)
MTGPTVPFSRVKVRTGGLVFCGDDIALIRRDRPTGSHYTPPGGNVHTGEDLLDALARERAEELRLDLGDATAPELPRTRGIAHLTRSMGVIKGCSDNVL